jgi:hypothetical protein
MHKGFSILIPKYNPNYSTAEEVINHRIKSGHPGYYDSNEYMKLLAKESDEISNLGYLSVGYLL